MTVTNFYSFIPRESSEEWQEFVAGLHPQLRITLDNISWQDVEILGLECRTAIGTYYTGEPDYYLDVLVEQSDTFLTENGTELLIKDHENWYLMAANKLDCMRLIVEAALEEDIDAYFHSVD